LSSGVSIRAAERSDVEQIYAWIVELAEYERSPDAVTGTPAQLEQALFGDQPTAEAVIAVLAGAPVGMALFYTTFSTWECLPGLWLEDLYVPPQQRRAGVGRALIAHLATIAVQRGHPRLEWAALDWNTPALQFYDKLGAVRLTDWCMHRLEGDGLSRIARDAD
jgi:GNAT superfamily N-acetyltransferase